MNDVERQHKKLYHYAVEVVYFRDALDTIHNNEVPSKLSWNIPTAMWR